MSDFDAGQQTDDDMTEEQLEAAMLCHSNNFRHAHLRQTRTR
jgi:hypothetical protein